MTTNKPEVVGYITTKSGVLLGGDDGFSTTDFSDQLAHRNPGGIAAEPVIRLSDYEALQAECEKLVEELKSAIEFCENPANRRRQTLLQQCHLLDRLRADLLEAITPAHRKQGGSND